MKKQCFIYGIIFILLALILEFSLLYVNADHFISTMILGIVLIFGGAVLVISGITGKAPFTGKELKQVETKPKKQYNLKKTFIVTGIVQAAFLLAYALWVLIFYCLPDECVIPDIMALLFGLLMLVPVMPVCLAFNATALVNSSDRNNKVIKWVYVIFCALAMSAAWLIYGVLVVILTGI